MFRRQLTLVVVALASLVITACSTSPTAPRTVTPTASVRDGGTFDTDSTTKSDTTSRGGWSGSNG